MTGDLAGTEQWAGFQSRSRIRQDNSLDVSQGKCQGFSREQRSRPQNCLLTGTVEEGTVEEVQNF